MSGIFYNQESNFIIYYIRYYVSYYLIIYYYKILWKWNVESDEETQHWKMTVYVVLFQCDYKNMRLWEWKYIMKIWNKQWENVTRKTVRWKIRTCVQILFVATLCVKRLWITHLAIRMTDVAQIQPEHLVPITNEKNENEPTVV